MIYPSDVGSFISSSTLVSKKAKENVLQTWMKRKPNCTINKTACVKLCSTKSLLHKNTFRPGILCLDDIVYDDFADHF